MKSMKRRSTLERQMLTYFGLLAAASLLITIEFIWAIQTAMSQAHVFAGTPASSSSQWDVVTTALATLRNKALLMFVVQGVVTLIVFVMFIRRITVPLQEMVEHSRLISGGDLGRTIEIRRQDEIGLLGETINGLTSDIQELVTYGLSMETSVRNPLQNLRNRIGSDTVSREELDEIERKLTSFHEVLGGFKLFPPPLQEPPVEEKR
jgi:methyl-accepting chemotaxis protein